MKKNKKKNISIMPEKIQNIMLMKKNKKKNISKKPEKIQNIMLMKKNILKIKEKILNLKIKKEISK